MNQNPEVSVVIPCYNVQDYIRDCLKSVIDQSFRDFEIILVDDGSTDNTADEISIIAKENTDIPIKYFFQENKGQGIARNLGAEMASGKYLAFIDSDDKWTKDSLAKKILIFRSDPVLDIVYSDAYLMIDGKIQDDTYKKYVLGFHRENIFLELLRRNFILTSSAIVKIEIFLKFGGQDKAGRFSSEDYFFWLKAARGGCKFNFIDEPTVYYRIHRDNTTRYLETVFLKVLELYNEIGIMYVLTREEKFVLEKSRKNLIYLTKKIQHKKYLRTGSIKEAKSLSADIFKEEKSVKNLISLGLTFIYPGLLLKYYDRKNSRKQFYY